MTLRAGTALSGLCGALLAACASGPAARSPEEESLFDGRSLGSWKPTEFGGEGKVRVEDGQIIVEAGVQLSGIHWAGGPLPRTNYELTLEARKIDGNDIFCGIAFPVGNSFCSFVAGGWGGTVTGLSSVDGMNASENETGTYREYEKGRWYLFRLKVTPERIQVWVDDQPVVDLALKERSISIHPAMELSQPLGLATYQTTSAFRKIRLRKL
ncbi:MAG: DUF1080 domain-containing protein [Planctomycetota bacterium]